jgi:hypothetical protein
MPSERPPGVEQCGGRRTLQPDAQFGKGALQARLGVDARRQLGICDLIDVERTALAALPQVLGRSCEPDRIGAQNIDDDVRVDERHAPFRSARRTASGLGSSAGSPRSSFINSSVVMPRMSRRFASRRNLIALRASLSLVGRPIAYSARYRTSRSVLVRRSASIAASASWKRMARSGSSARRRARAARLKRQTTAGSSATTDAERGLPS